MGYVISVNDKNIEVKEDRNKKLGVTKAIEIISEIDNQALLALTVLYAFLYLIPIEGNVNRGLDILEELYSKILYQELPENNTWIDHLEILKTIKIYPYKTNIKTSDICAETFDGYAAVGIKKTLLILKRHVDFYNPLRWMRELSWIILF